MRRITLFLFAFLFALAFTADTADLSWSAKCTGAQEVPATTSDASALVKLGWSGVDQAINYSINVTNLRNIRSVHIHIARAGSEGPVAATLLGNIDRSRPTKSNGRIHVGQLYADDLVGPFEDARSLTPLIDAIRQGRAYVNFHTDDGVGGTNLGPGDFSDGEIRGQIK